MDKAEKNILVYPGLPIKYIQIWSVCLLWVFTLLTLFATICFSDLKVKATEVIFVGLTRIQGNLDIVYRWGY